MSVLSTETWRIQRGIGIASLPPRRRIGPSLAESTLTHRGRLSVQHLEVVSAFSATARRGRRELGGEEDWHIPRKPGRMTVNFVNSGIHAGLCNRTRDHERQIGRAHV